MNPIVDLARAYHFAALRHRTQKRKGEAEEPYINHLTEVAELVARATGGEDPEAVIAAVLHDAIEDTETTPAEIAQAFGEDVAGLVAEVTDDKSLDKAERKRRQVEHAAHASLRAQVIKLADKTSNLRSLRASPPKGWPQQRIAEYLDWARRVVDACRGANPWLEREFDLAAAALEVKLATEPA
ncbi:MAG TPA: HD domain-containing protein [Caulobacteraceae bacterium]|nr:HD domain-containing protein [Caulobacteraceae bacterium]